MNSIDNKLSLAPLGAGDLIERAVRLYRRHFLTRIRVERIIFYSPIVY